MRRLSDSSPNSSRESHAILQWPPSSAPAPLPPSKPAIMPVHKSTAGAHGPGSTVLGSRQHHQGSGKPLVKSKEESLQQGLSVQGATRIIHRRAFSHQPAGVPSQTGRSVSQHVAQEAGHTVLPTATTQLAYVKPSPSATRTPRGPARKRAQSQPVPYSIHIPIFFWVEGCRASNQWCGCCQKFKPHRGFLSLALGPTPITVRCWFILTPLPSNMLLSIATLLHSFVSSGRRCAVRSFLVVGKTLINMLPIMGILSVSR